MSQCRSCEAPIIWVKHKRTGNVLPVDAEPTDKGNLRIVGEAMGKFGAIPAVESVQADELPGMGEPTKYMPHHATCPDAADWHRS